MSEQPVYPSRGATPWDGPLRDYIDGAADSAVVSAVEQVAEDVSTPGTPIGDALLAEFVARSETHTAALGATLRRVDLNFALSSSSANLEEVWANGKRVAWLNEWGALRGVSPYGWGDALVRAIRETGDGINNGNFAELEDRRGGTTTKVWARRWADGALLRNGVTMADVYVTTNAATDPAIATLPVGTVVLQIAAE